jgi:hypothetical protein
MAGLTGRNQFEENEYWTLQQQRFEAALKFATSSMLFGDQESGEYRQPTFNEAIEMADVLIAKLEETRTKANETDYS